MVCRDAESVSLRLTGRWGVDGVSAGLLAAESVPAEDAMWTRLCQQAEQQAAADPLAGRFLSGRVLLQRSLDAALASILVSRLECSDLPAAELIPVFEASLGEPEIGRAVRHDLRAVCERDPVAQGELLPFLSFKGFHALQSYRVTHWLWQQSRRALAVYLQNRVATVFGVDIHPAARLGSGLLMDHATGIVIGETSVVEDNVSLLHEVTLGGTGKETGDRHPKVRAGVLIGAGAKLLGNIEIGTGAKVGAGSVVLDSVPPHCTVAGVPARIVARSSSTIPALEMDQQFPHCFEAGGGI